jgi:hypothetical protein
MVGHLHYLVADVIGQRPAVDKYSAELVDAALAERSGYWEEKGKKKRRKVT